jgi:hypothetical protein
MTSPRRHVPAAVLFAAALTLLAPLRATAEDCRPGATVLCLENGRFRVNLAWESAAPSPAATAVAERAGTFTPDADRPGVVVHLTDGRADNGHFWVQQHAAPELAYSLMIEDLQTGERRTYRHAPGDADEADLYALREGFPQGGAPVAPAPEERGHDGGVRLAGGLLQVAAHGSRSDKAELAGERAGDDTAVFRAGREGDPALVVSVIDARDRDGSWWVLSSAPGGAASAFEVTGLDIQAAQRLTRQGAQTELARLPAAAAGISIVLDTARAAQASLSEKGGTLRATSANGVVFTLTVPAKALFARETIKLTPFKSVQRLPFSPGLVGGVQIDPPGLRFSGSASLRIAPPQPVAKAQETTFGDRTAGAQFFLYPAALGAPAVILTLTHTGGYGLARATAAEQQAQLKRLPPLAEDRFDQKLWALHSRLRQGKSLSPAAAPSAVSFFKDDYNSSLRPLLLEIAASCAGRKKWGSYAENFIAQATLDGIAGSLVNEIALLRKALNLGTARCYNEAAISCLNDQDPHAVLPLLSAWRWLEAAGATNLVDSLKAHLCLVFEFELNSTMDDSYPPASSHHVIDSKIRVQFLQPFHFGVGEAAPNAYKLALWTAANPDPYNCTWRFTQNFAPDKLQVPFLFFNANWYEEPPPLKIELVYDTGDPMAELESTCPGGGGSKDFVDWLALDYLALHLSEKGGDDEVAPLGLHSFVEKGWTVFQNEIFASKGYVRSTDVGGARASEVTGLFLRHRPGQ